MNPSPKKATKAARQVLQRKVEDAFPKARVETFGSGHRFHDRFYLARDKSGRLSGTFGPSLSGLGAHAVVLMGEVEKGALEKLRRLLS